MSADRGGVCFANCKLFDLVVFSLSCCSSAVADFFLGNFMGVGAAGAARRLEKLCTY